MPGRARTAGVVLDDLAVIGLRSLAHRLVENLELFIPVDPLGVFLRVANIVRAGKMWGYEYEDMTQDLIARIIERYLADIARFCSRISNPRLPLERLLRHSSRRLPRVLKR